MTVKRALLAALCVVLLFVQHAAHAHALWHAAQQRSSHEQRALDQEHRERPGPRDAFSLCTLDAVLGQVLGAIPPTPHVLPAEKLPSEAPAYVRYACPAAERHPPLCRGPPSFLTSTFRAA